MIGRAAAAAVVVSLLLSGIAAERAAAHAGVVVSEPAAGADLGASPEAVTLTFSEQPEASLSEIEVLDDSGAALQSGPPHAVSGQPLTLSVPVPRLARGVYTVDYRTVSAVDGHATAGAFAFGVRASPAGVAATATTAAPDTSALEVVARWLLLLGLVALIGAAIAGAAGFGGREGTDLRLAAGGWAVSVAGLVLLAAAQRRTAGSSLGELFDTAVGDALIWRAVGLAVTGAALLYAARRPEHRREALAVAALGALEVIYIHVDAGHAAAGGWSAGVSVTTQVAHFAAAGIWFGGLAALLLGIRGVASAEKAAAVRRFAVVAAAAVVVVFVTGSLRVIDELSSWGELFDTGYGRAVLAKLILIALIVALAVRNSRRGVPAAESDLGPLRRTSRAELGLAVVALGVAALLGTLAPPVAGQPAATPGLAASGADFATTVRVELTAASDEPGPNRFVAALEDYDTGDPVDADRVTLRFRSLDDPAAPPSSLDLRPAGDGSFAASGANLVLDGRWAVTALIERGGDSVEVPLELYLQLPSSTVSIVRPLHRPPKYTMDVPGGSIRISPDPERPGPSEVHVNLYGPFDKAPAEQIVVSGSAVGEPLEEWPLTRLTNSQYVAEVDLEPGPFTINVVAQATQDRRLRASFPIDVPAR